MQPVCCVPRLCSCFQTQRNQLCVSHALTGPRPLQDRADLALAAAVEGQAKRLAAAVAGIERLSRRDLEAALLAEELEHGAAEEPVLPSTSAPVLCEVPVYLTI